MLLCDTPTDACVLGDLALKENLLGEFLVCFRLLCVRGVLGESGLDGPPSLEVPLSSPSAGVPPPDTAAEASTLGVATDGVVTAGVAAAEGVSGTDETLGDAAPRAVFTRPFRRSLFRSLGSRYADCCFRSGEEGMPGSPRSSGGGNCTPLSSNGGDVPVAP